MACCLNCRLWCRWHLCLDRCHSMFTSVENISTIFVSFAVYQASHMVNNVTVVYWYYSCASSQILIVDIVTVNTFAVLFLSMCQQLYCVRKFSFCGRINLLTWCSCCHEYSVALEVIKTKLFCHKIFVTNDNSYWIALECGVFINYVCVCVFLLVVHDIMNKLGCADHTFSHFIASLLHYNPGSLHEKFVTDFSSQ